MINVLLEEYDSGKAARMVLLKDVLQILRCSCTLLPTFMMEWLKIVLEQLGGNIDDRSEIKLGLNLVYQESVWHRALTQQCLLVVMRKTCKHCTLNTR